MIDKSLLEGLKAGNNKVLKSIYLDHKEAFLNYVRRYGLERHEAVDIYQDAILALRENVATGRLVELKSTLKTYLFSIGKYLVFDYLRANKKMTPVDFKAIENDYFSEGFEILFKEESNPKEEQLERAFSTLGSKCKAILTLFYYQGYSIEEIANILDYNNKDVAKSQKSRCLRTLKDILNDGR